MPTQPNEKAPELDVLANPVEDTAGKHKPAADDKPGVVDTEPCISPTEQNKLSGKSGPKKRGRPPSAKAKAKARAKAQAKSKARAKAVAKAKGAPANKRARSKTPKAEKNGEAADEFETEHKTTAGKRSRKSKVSTASSSHEGVVKKQDSNKDVAGATKTASNRKRKAKAEVEDASKEDTGSAAADTKDDKQKTLDDLPTVVRTKRKASKLSKSAPETSEKDDNDSTAATSHTQDEATKKKQETKQRNSRKSAAYHRAMKQAKDQGLSDDQCRAAGKKVFWSYLVYFTCVLVVLWKCNILFCVYWVYCFMCVWGIRRHPVRSEICWCGCLCHFWRRARGKVKGKTNM